MKVWLALRRLLPLLAVLSLALTPVTASAATAGMHASMTAQSAATHEAMSGADDEGMADMGLDDMPCCPPEKAAKSGCGKDCPLMALCLAGTASLLPTPISIPVPVATRTSPVWSDAAFFASMHGPPLPEPPRA